MSVYLDEEFCKKIIEKSMTTSITKLNKISEINDKNSKKYKKLFKELKAINNIIESVNVYLDLIKVQNVQTKS
jgi:hypothetical protein